MNNTLYDSLDDFTVERENLKEDIRTTDSNICHLNKNLLVIQICSHFKDAVIKIYSIHVITK